MALAALSGASALGQEAQPQKLGAVVVVRDAQDQRRAPQTAVLFELFRETGIVSTADVAAWDNLAKALNLDRDQAVDQLLGRRFVLLLGERDGGPLRWTAMSDVSRETGKRLVEQLKPSPRGTRDGKVLWALEGGRFDLCRTPAPDNLQTLTLSPSDASLDTDVGDGLAGVDLGAGVKADVWARVYLNAGPAAVRPPGADPARNSLEFTANRTKRGWDIVLSAPPTLMGVCAEMPEAVAGEPTEALSSPNVLMRAEGWMMAGVELPANHPAVQYFSQFSVLGVPLPEQANLGPRYSYVLERTVTGGRTGISMTAAIEVKDLNKAAQQGDAMVAGFLNLPTRVNAITKALQELPEKLRRAFDKNRKDDPKPAPQADLTIIAHAGENPSAIRVATLRPAQDAQKSDKQAVLSWVYLPHGAGVGEGGWWVIHMETGPDAEMRAEQVLRDAVKDLEMRRTRFPALLMEIRPAALHELLSADGVKWEGWIGAMRHVDYAKIDLWRGADGRVQGHSVLDMVLPKAGATDPVDKQQAATGPAKEAAPR